MTAFTRIVIKNNHTTNNKITVKTQKPIKSQHLIMILKQTNH